MGAHASGTGPSLEALPRAPPPTHCCLQVKTVTPVGDRVFVKAEEAESKTVGGILLPSTAQKRPTQGTVQSAGGAKAVKVRRPRACAPCLPYPAPPRPQPPPQPLRCLQAGDKVVYSKYAGTELEVQGEQFVLLKVRAAVGAGREASGRRWWAGTPEPAAAAASASRCGLFAARRACARVAALHATLTPALTLSCASRHPAGGRRHWPAGGR